MGMFDEFLDSSFTGKEQVKVEVKPPQLKKPKVVFDIDFDARTEVEIVETVYDPNKYKVNCGDLSLYCAAMFGGPLF